jgi:hypothetical protein
MRLLTPASYQTKLRKSEHKQTEYSVYSVSLSPADYAGTGRSNCPSSTPSCESACVGGDGIGMAAIWRSVMESRVRKTLYLQEDRQGFLAQLNAEIVAARIREESDGRTLAVRLNAFSDVPWEHKAYGEIPQRHPGVVFYDYTAVLSRRPLPNYALSFSWKGTNGAACIELLNAGLNVSVCFAERGAFAGNAALRQRLPKRYRLPGSEHAFEVFDGDASDLRMLDPGPTAGGYGRICGLRLKAGSTEQREHAIADDSGFVQIVG